MSERKAWIEDADLRERVIEATEGYVQCLLFLMDRGEAARDMPLVRAIASRIVRSLPEWVSDAETTDDWNASMLPRPMPKLSRIEVIDQHGRWFAVRCVDHVAISLQDDERTLKIFCRSPRD